MRLILLVFLLFSSIGVARVVSPVPAVEALVKVQEVKESIVLLTNPVKNGVLKVRVYNSTSSQLSVAIINSLGDQIYQQSRPLKKDIMIFDLADLSAGIYYLQMKTGKTSVVKKLIIQ